MAVPIILIAMQDLIARATITVFLDSFALKIMTALPLTLALMISTVEGISIVHPILIVPMILTAEVTLIVQVIITAQIGLYAVQDPESVCEGMEYYADLSENRPHLFHQWLI